MDRFPGRRVLVTRAAHQAGKLSSALRTLGLEPVEVPVLEIQPPDDFAPLDAALLKLVGQANDPGCPIHPPDAAATGGWVGDRESQPTGPHYDWLILTSANAVRALADRATPLGIAASFSPSGRDNRVLKGHDFSRAVQDPKNAGALAPEGVFPKIAAIGEATAAAARDAGLTVSLIPDTYVAESLVESFAGRVAGKRILIARAAIARDVIPDALRAAGATVDVVDAYRNAIPASAPAQLREALKQGIEAVTFTSSSSVTHLAAVAKQANIAFPFPNIPAISIGPITTQTLREHNWPPAAEATVSDTPGLAAAVAKLLR